MVEFQDVSEVCASLNSTLTDASETNNFQNDLQNDVNLQLTDTKNVADNENPNGNQVEEGEINEVFHKGENLSGIGSDILKTSNSPNGTPCHLTENVSDKKNVSANQKEVDVPKDTFLAKDSMNDLRHHESEFFDFKKYLLCEDVNKLSEIPDDTKEEYLSLMQELKLLRIKGTLLKLQTVLLDHENDLSKVMINLYQERLKLTDIKYEIFMNNLINAFQAMLKYINVEVKNSNGLEISKSLQKALEEMHSIFLQFKDMYKTCESCLEKFLQIIKNILNITANDTQIKESALFSVLESLVLRIDSFSLASIKDTFSEFETFINMYETINAVNTDEVDFVMDAFEKAENAYSELDLVISKIRNHGFSNV